MWKVQTVVTAGYKDSARQLANADFKLFVSDINHLGHPPGYSILLAGIFHVVGRSDIAIHVVQIFADSVAVVLLFLIAVELLPVSVAAIAGVLAALSPQFAYFSILLLPDSLSVAPILLAVYLIVRAGRHPSIWKFVLVLWLASRVGSGQTLLLLAPFLLL